MKRPRPRWFFAALLSALFVTACDKGGESPEKDDAKSEKDDDEDDEDKGKKKKKKDKGSDTAKSGDKAEKPPAPVDNSVTFSRKDPAVGDVQTETNTKLLTLKFELAGQSFDIENETSKKETKEVLAVSGGAVTKKKVTYAMSTERDKKAGKEKNETKPVQGKTYIIEKKGEEVVVTDEGGKPVPKPEEDIVKKDNESIGKPDPIISQMPTRPLKPGERVPELENAMQLHFLEDAGKDGNKTNFTAFEVTFKEKKGDVGVFSIKLTMEVDEEGKMKMTIPFQGTMEMRIADSWPASLSMDGVVTMGPGPKATAEMASLKGNGKMTMKFSYSYGKP